MAKSTQVSVLHVGQNGQVTVPAGFRKAHSLSQGGTVLAIPMGETLVLAPHDVVLESVCMRLEEAMKGAGVTVAELNRAALAERAVLVKKRYGQSGRS